MICKSIEKRTRVQSGVVSCFFFTVLFTSYLSAQNQSAPASPSQSPQPAGSKAVITQQIDEISLDMVVHQKKNNKPVLNLTSDDLAVTENGIPVKLKNFQLVKGDSPKGHLVTFVFEGFEGPTAKTAQNLALKILKSISLRDCQFSVLDVRGRLRLMQDFTNDRATVERSIMVETDSKAMRLQSTATTAVNLLTDAADGPRKDLAAAAEKNLIAIARTGADAAGVHVDVRQRALSQTLISALRDSHKVMQDQHAPVNLAGLLAVIRSQQGLTGRRAVIYFTQNRQLDSTAKEMIKTLTGAAARGGITLYVVDTDALATGTQHQADNAMLNGGVAFNPGPREVPGSGGMASATPVQQPSGYGFSQNALGSTADFMMRSEGNPFVDRKNPMADLAVATGGVYLDAQASYKKQLQQLVTDLTNYYDVTYEPSVQEYDGSFRSIDVKTRKAGLVVQAKTGYYAVPPGAEAGARPFEIPILKALEANPLPADFHFHTAVLRHGELPDGETSTLAVEVPLSELQVKKDTQTNLFTAHAAIVAEIKDKNGTVVEHFAEDMTKRGALETLDRDQGTTLSLQRHFISIPGTYTVNVGIQDELSGKISGQRMALDIAEAKTTPDLSDIVLVRKMDPVREDDDDPLDPLRYEKSKITPNLSDLLAANAKGVSMFFFLHPDPGVKEMPTLEMSVSRDGKPGRRMPLPLRWQASEGTAVPYLASFGSSTLAPGRYEVKAYLNHGGKTAVQTLSFEVEGNNSVSGPGGKTSGDNAIAVSAADSAIAVPGQLAITALKSPATALSDVEARMLVEDARKHALSYHDSLPNFMVLEVTNRSVDSSGRGDWKHQDSIVELLRYRDKQETRTTIEVNGKPSETSHEGMRGALSEGEFGGVLKAIFSETAKADFQWKETAALNDGTVQVFNFRVPKENSMFGVVATNGRELIVGFHGQVFVDSTTRSVRRAVLIADDLPQSFSTHYSSMAVDYDYVAINEHDYLLPVSAEMRLIKGKHTGVLNTIEFRNYKRFGSNLRILDFKPVDDKDVQK